MNRRLLVLTTVHHPDDNRIREKTIRSLADSFDVWFATRAPGPADSSGLTWLPLRGGRLRRNLSAWRIALGGRFDIVSLHDPELLPLGIAVSRLRRSRVVFDVHEDIPAQLLTKSYLPRLVRCPLAAILVALLRVAERTLELTLAEASYGRVMRRRHPVISNYPETGHLPLASSSGSGAIYVGDVTVVRGVIDAVRACGLIGVPLTIVGPMTDEMASQVAASAADVGATVEMTGRLPHGEAMEAVARSEVALSPLQDIPNYRHSIPTKVLEYLAVGVPVVASDLPATRELVDGLSAVALYPPGDVAALGAAIESVRSDQARTAARIQASEVRERFRWPSKDLVDLYDRISG